MTAPPTSADLARHLGVPDDPDVLGRAVAVAGAWLTAHYLCDPYTDTHHLAQLHMAARFHQARGAPLGVIDGGDLGATWVPSRNAVVREMLTDPRGGFA